MQEVHFEDLGVIPFREAWDYQQQYVDHINSIKLENRNKGHNQATPNYLFFCHHPHVYTLGKSGSTDNLLWDTKKLEEKGVEFVHTNRGGDITYHGPGQIVGYPVIDLENYFTDLNRYLRTLEEVIIKTLSDFGIEADRSEGLTGVWLDTDKPDKARKICAMGVKCSRWVTMHGFALNVTTNLDYFSGIVPCGIQDKAVTSIEKELDNPPGMDEVKSRLLKHFGELFESQIRTLKEST